MRYSGASNQTVEAEIKRNMTLQRVRAAENRTGNSSANGPLRAQSAEAGKTATCRHTSVVGDMLVSCKSASAYFSGKLVNQGGTASIRSICSSLTANSLGTGVFVCPPGNGGIE